VSGGSLFVPFLVELLDLLESILAHAIPVPLVAFEAVDILVKQFPGDTMMAMVSP
jgi:hypothetical protein